MSFSNQAIGFYLQLDDQLTPGLKAASKSYTQFTKMLDKQNQRAVASVNKGFSAMSSLVKSFDAMPKRATAAYAKTFRALQRSARPIQQAVDITISTKKVQNSLATAIAGAVRKALESMTLTMHPALPKSRARGFNTKQSLRAAYRNMTQPPDLVGRAKVPRFAKGGEVTAGSGRKGIDDVIAMLGKGEMVIPAKEAKILKGLAKVTRLNPRFVQGLADMQNLAAAMEKLVTKGSANGLSRGEKGQLRGATLAQDKLRLQTVREFRKLGKGTQGALNAELTKATNSLRTAAASSQNLLKSMSLTAKVVRAIKGGFAGLAGSVKQIASSTKFLSVMEAFKTLKNNFREGLHGVGQIMGAKGDVNGPIEGLNLLNRGLHLTRDELAHLGATANKMSAEYGDTVLNPTVMTEALTSLARAGARSQAEFEKLAPTVALATQAMHISEDVASGLARRLGTTFGMTKDAVADTFADLGRIAAKTGVEADDLASSLMDDTERMGAFVVNLSAKDQKTVLSSMAELQGTLTKNFGDTGNKIGGMLSDALNDATSEAAQNVANLTGLTGGSSGTLAAALRSGNASQVISGIAGRAKQAGGSSTLTAQLAGALGFPGSSMEFAQFSKSASNMVGDLNDLHKGAIGAGNGFAALRENAGSAISLFEQGQNWSANNLPGVAPKSDAGERALLEFPPGRVADAASGAASAVHMGQNILSTVGGAAILRKLLPSLFGRAATAGALGAGGAAAGGAAGGGILARGMGLLKGAGPLALIASILSLKGSVADGMGPAPDKATPAAISDFATGKYASNSYGQLQNAAAKSVYSSEHPFRSIFPVDPRTYSSPDMVAKAQALLTQKGITPGNAKFLKSAGADGPLTSDQIINATTAAEAAKATAAAGAGTAELLRQLIAMMPNLAGPQGAPPANGTVAGPPRPRPADRVVESAARGGF